MARRKKEAFTLLLVKEEIFTILRFLAKFLARLNIRNIIDKIYKIIKGSLTNIIVIRKQITANIWIVWHTRTKNREGASISTVFWSLAIMMKVAGWRKTSPGMEDYPGKEGAGRIISTEQLTLTFTFNIGHL